MITAARSTAVGTPLSSRIRATSARDRRCAEGRPSRSAGAGPPRYTIRRTPAARAASAKFVAASRSAASNPRWPSECTR